MTLEEWHKKADESIDSDARFALAAQQMPGLSGLYIRNQSVTVIVRSPVPGALPSDSAYPPLEGAVPIMERSPANILAMIALMYGEDSIYLQFPVAFEEGVYEARQLFYWKYFAPVLLADAGLDTLLMDVDVPENRLTVGIEDVDDAPKARAALVAGGIPDDALEIVEVRVRPSPEFD